MMHQTMKQNRPPLRKRIADASEPYLYSAPALILIVAVMLVPLVVGISYAFRDIQLLNPCHYDCSECDHGKKHNGIRAPLRR